MRHWIVEFNTKGQATRCDPVPFQETDKDRCYVVEARTREVAIELASKLYKARQKKLVRLRRDKYEAEGRCRCGRERDGSEYKYCKACRLAHRTYDQTWRNRKDGKQPAKQTLLSPDAPITPHGEAIARTRRSTQQMARLQALLDVQQWWADAATPEDFGRRVASEIRLLQEIQ
jgi:hypothetical protein